MTKADRENLLGASTSNEIIPTSISVSCPLVQTKFDQVTVLDFRATENPSYYICSFLTTLRTRAPIIGSNHHGKRRNSPGERIRLHKFLEVYELLEARYRQSGYQITEDELVDPV
jgi:hypothetical protein